MTALPRLQPGEGVLGRGEGGKRGRNDTRVGVR